MKLLPVEEKWYNQILLLTEAIPLSQAKYYTSIDRQIGQQVISTVWDKLVNLGGTLSRNKQRISFDFKIDPEIEFKGGKAKTLLRHGEFLITLATLLDAGLKMKQTYASGMSDEDREYEASSLLQNYNRYIEEYSNSLYSAYTVDRIELSRSKAILDLNSNVVEISTRKIKTGKIIDEILKKYITRGFDNLSSSLPFHSMLKQAYVEYTTVKSNLGTSKENKEYAIIIGKHPVDIAGMSSGRGWVSCMTLPGDPKSPKGGGNQKYVACDVKYGTLIAYLVNKTDQNINRPIGRLLIKPYYHKVKNTVIYIPEIESYGTVPVTFYSTIEDLFDKVNSKATLDRGVYKLAKKLYPDDPDSGGVFALPMSKEDLTLPDLKLVLSEVSKIVEDLNYLYQDVSKIVYTREGIINTLKRGTYEKAFNSLQKIRHYIMEVASEWRHSIGQEVKFTDIRDFFDEGETFKEFCKALKALANTAKENIIDQIDYLHQTNQVNEDIDSVGSVLDALQTLAFSHFDFPDLLTVDLQGANLAGVKLGRTNLQKVNLQGANFSNSNLRNVYAGEANLQNINLSNAELKGVILTWTELMGAVCTHTKFNDIDLEYIKNKDVTGVDFRNARFTGRIEGRPNSLQGIDFSRVKNRNMSGVDFINMNLSEARFNNVNLAFSVFKNITQTDDLNLTGVNLSYATFENCDFSKTIGLETCTGLDTIQYDKNTIWPKGFNIENYK